MKTEWHHKFFDDLYGRVLAGQHKPETTLRQGRLVKRLLRLREGQSVLDCPCGQGRLTVPLAKMGLRMTGVDFQPAYLARARRAAAKARVKVELVRYDMRDRHSRGAVLHLAAVPHLISQNVQSHTVVERTELAIQQRDTAAGQSLPHWTGLSRANHTLPGEFSMAFPKFPVDWRFSWRIGYQPAVPLHRRYRSPVRLAPVHADG